MVHDRKPFFLIEEKFISQVQSSAPDAHFHGGSGVCGDNPSAPQVPLQSETIF